MGSRQALSHLRLLGRSLFLKTTISFLNPLYHQHRDDPNVFLEAETISSTAFWRRNNLCDNFFAIQIQFLNSSIKEFYKTHISYFFNISSFRIVKERLKS
mmetsp:Transcript_39876/g.81640  ORF Transcript_39876/g.81640 Transcript_39876/m.81640 type:complete len:100 (-) Transcript_39876:34-333(-)